MAFHGAKDETVKLEDDEAGVNAIKACGGDAHRRNEANAQQILALRAAREARIKQQFPATNAEATLRRLVSEFAAGNLDYSQMTPTLATQSRRTAETMQAKLKAFGPLDALRYKGVPSKTARMCTTPSSRTAGRNVEC